MSASTEATGFPPWVFAFAALFGGGPATAVLGLAFGFAFGTPAFEAAERGGIFAEASQNWSWRGDLTGAGHHANVSHEVDKPLCKPAGIAYLLNASSNY